VKKIVINADTFIQLEEAATNDRLCECGHGIHYHPYDLVYGSDGSEDEVYSCTAFGCQCRNYEEVQWNRHK
jgi:hypothetical protein